MTFEFGNMAEIEKKWYVMRAISGKEGKVKEYIDAMVAQHEDIARNVGQVLIPTAKVVTVRNGKRVVKEQNRFSGYVFVEASLVGETQQQLRNVPNVLGFLTAATADTHPMPMTPSEVAHMLGTVDELQDVPEEIVIPFEVGESVKVTDGPFNGFDAVIEEISTEKKKLKVVVKIFGRKTPMELGFMQVEKL